MADTTGSGSAGTSVAYDDLARRVRRIATLRSVGALLAWDQETMMPPRAAEFRAEELSLVAELAHEHMTDPRLAELVRRCEADSDLAADEAVAADLRDLHRDIERASKLPTELVAELSQTSSKALEAWREARERSDFATFRPWLERVVELNRRKASCYGVPEGGEAYDALLEDFEPGMTAVELERLFRPLRDGVTPLIEEIGASSVRPDGLADRTAPVPEQQRFHAFVLEAIGYDLDAGRLDVSTHPFTEGLAPGDTRITTRFAGTTFLDALGSTLHEAGHALYEQGLPKDTHHGYPRAEAASLGMHESQSRLWENQVGRSRAFWEWATPHAHRFLGDAVAGVDAEALFRASNVVRPHWIRVESDEVTYNLHILMRFDLERAMLRGDLAVADLPTAWNDRVRADLGLEVPDDARGCLQDIHWSMGAIGYFPTYTLGNLYSAQLWEAIVADLPDLDDRMRRGEFAGLLEWLRSRVHRAGRRHRAARLCREITGEDLAPEPLLRYLEAKLRPIYGIERR